MIHIKERDANYRCSLKNRTDTAASICLLYAPDKRARYADAISEFLFGHAFLFSRAANKSSEQTNSVFGVF